MFFYAPNVSMTLALFYHLKQQAWLLWKAILFSRLIEFFAYCLMMTAIRNAKPEGFNLFRLKMIREALILLVFTDFLIG